MHCFALCCMYNTAFIRMFQTILDRLSIASCNLLAFWISQSCLIFSYTTFCLFVVRLRSHKSALWTEHFCCFFWLNFWSFFVKIHTKVEPVSESGSEFQKKFIAMAWKYKLVPIITSILFAINVIQLVKVTLDTDNNKSVAYAFGQLNTIVCVLLGLIVYRRYHQTKRLICQHSDLMEVIHLNRKTGCVGFVMCLFYPIVAAFLQEYQNSIVFDLIRIFTLFCPFTMYFLWQYEITLKLQPYIGSMELTCFRMNLALVCKWMLKFLFSTKFIWLILVFMNDPAWIWWTAAFEIAAHILGLILVITFSFYIFTFVYDFEVIESTQSVV